MRRSQWLQVFEGCRKRRRGQSRARAAGPSRCRSKSRCLSAWARRRQERRRSYRTGLENRVWESEWWESAQRLPPRRRRLWGSEEKGRLLQGSEDWARRRRRSVCRCPAKESPASWGLARRVGRTWVSRRPGWTCGRPAQVFSEELQEKCLSSQMNCLLMNRFHPERQVW